MKICRPCSHIGCHELTNNRYCEKHMAQHQAQHQQQVRQSNRAYNMRRPEYHSLYSTKEWHGFGATNSLSIHGALSVFAIALGQSQRRRTT